MSARIHPTAGIDPQAQLDPTVTVGPHAIIEGQVTIGAGTRIGPHAWIRSGTTLGAHNHVHYGTVIGHWPQDVTFSEDTESFVRIGDHNNIREYVTIHRGTTPGSTTTIGDHGMLMVGAHIAHNCHIGNRVMIANNTCLGGHVQVDDEAFLSAQCVVHQFARIGRLAMVGGMAGVGQDVCPYLMASMRNQIVGVNVVGLRRAGIASAARAEIKQAFKTLYLSGLSVASALDEIEQTSTCIEVARLVAFARASKRGLCSYRGGQQGGNASGEQEVETLSRPAQHWGQTPPF